MKEIRGRCLCGAVEVAMPDAFEYVGYCHCSECRRFSGSPFAAFGRIPKSDFRVLKGTESIRTYPKSEKTILAFCQTCGSSLYAEKPRKGTINVRLGILDDAPSMKPQGHSYATSKASWYEITDDLPQFETVKP